MPRFQPDPELDYRAHPEAYRYSPDERGVFNVHPYKDELLPLWRFRDMQAATTSIEALNEKFEAYANAGDFIGMDMTRKYMQMGFTRAMRYAKYPGGRKYNEDGTQRDPQTWADPVKRQVAVAFRTSLEALRDDERYERALSEHKAGQEA